MENKYKTEQRKIIKDFLIENENKFVNANQIMNCLKKHNQIVGLSTIYRFLNMLEKEDKVRTEIINHTKNYQYISSKCCNHFHLKCKKCGKTIHLKCEEFENASKHIEEEHKFILDNNTMIYGLCQECNK